VGEFLGKRNKVRRVECTLFLLNTECRPAGFLSSVPSGVSETVYDARYRPCLFAVHNQVIRPLNSFLYVKKE
jgi:hypothetical protein